MNKVSVRYLKLSFCASVLTFCLFGLYSRYRYVNSFYLEYQKGQEKKAIHDFWLNPGVTVLDLRQAGVKNISMDGDDPEGPKGYSFEIKENKIRYFITGVSGDTVVGIDKGNKGSESTIVAISPTGKYKKSDIATKGAASAEEIKYYTKFSYDFMKRVQKQTYEYWQRNKMLRYKKMIPFYEYLRKN